MRAQLSALLRRPYTLMALGLLWMLGVGTGLYMLMDYSLTPGAGGEAPEGWPEQSRVLRHPTLPTLVMLVHPRCSCSRASLEELSRLLVRFHTQVSATILFYTPTGTAKDWEKTDLWRTAQALPGVDTVQDLDGAEARLFRVSTSGYTVLYDTTGRLLFHGGMTPSRGHVGDNAGSQAIAALLTARHAAHQRTPVFGCDVFDASEHNRNSL